MDPTELPSQIPVTLLTGFLGAGKTTLLNHILTTAHGHRIAVIENEFGPANIDADLLARQSARVVEMTNGCLCCTVLDDLAGNLLELKGERDAGRLLFDRVIIETTGLADPAPVARMFFDDPALADAFLLDAVLTVVDAVHGERQLTEQPVLQRQIGLADRLLLSKTDIAAAEATTVLAARLAEINPRAPLHRLEQGRIDLSALLDIRGFNLDEPLLADEIEAPVAFRPGRTADGFRGIGRPAARHAHGEAIGSLLLEHPGPVDLDRIGAFVQDMLARHGGDLLRYKGVLAVPQQPNKLIFQGVQRLAGFDYGNAWCDDEPPSSRIVVIGRNLPTDELREGFGRCLL